MSKATCIYVSRLYAFKQTLLHRPRNCTNLHQYCFFHHAIPLYTQRELATGQEGVALLALSMTH